MLKSVTSNQDIITIVLEGSIDSSNARELQKQILNELDKFDIIDGIIIDANELTYLSSLGMRTILWLKKEYEDVSMIGVSQQIFNVLKMTGFNKMLTVEMALQQLTSDGLAPVDNKPGFYHLSDDQVLKVFSAETQKVDVDKEVALAKALFVLGVPTTMAFEIVRVNDCLGVKYEKVQGSSSSDAALIGSQLRSLHAVEVEPEQKLHPIHIALKQKIQVLKPYLGDDAVQRLQYMLNTIPESYLLLVGNPTIDTLAFQDEELVIHDMETVGYGNPILDLSYLYASLTTSQQGDFFDELLHSYMGKCTEEEYNKTKDIVVTFSKIYSYLSLLDKGIPTKETVASYKKQFEQQIVECWDEVLSHLRFKIDFHEEIRKLERNLFFLKSGIDIDWVAQTIGTNRHYVSDYFNKVLHTTFNNYLNSQRLDYAYKLISTGQAKSTQVAFKCGFNSEHTFRRAFKQRFGCTPSQYEITE